LLPEGALVKSGIGWLRDHVLRVISDPGPEKDPQRTITVGRREPERSHEIYRVKRFNVRTPRVEE
jgi:hypothetical protein